MSFKNYVKASQIVPATSGRKMGRDRYRKTCGSYGHLWSIVYNPTYPRHIGLCFHMCERDNCKAVRWV